MPFKLSFCCLRFCCFCHQIAFSLSWLFFNQNRSELGFHPLSKWRHIRVYQSDYQIKKFLLLQNLPSSKYTATSVIFEILLSQRTLDVLCLGMSGQFFFILFTVFMNPSLSLWKILCHEKLERIWKVIKLSCLSWVQPAFQIYWNQKYVKLKVVNNIFTMLVKRREAYFYFNIKWKGRIF